MSGFNIDDYVTVAERVGSFYEKWPDGSLQAEVIEISDSRVVVRAYAYRTENDSRPGIAHSMLAIPGSTPYTKGSELENAETSAIGRAIAMLGFHVKKSMASQDEIRNKGGEVRADVAKGDDGSLIGTAEAGDKSTSDFLLRQTPEGSALGFRLRGAKGGILVETRGPLADQVMQRKYDMIGKTVTVWGAVTDRSFTPPKGRKVTYQVLTAERIRVPEVGDLPVLVDEPPYEAESVPLFSDEEQAEIDAALALA